MKHKKRLSGRFMAFLLTAVLVFSSLSLSAFAGTSDDESADAAEAVTAAEETVTTDEDDAATADEADTEESAAEETAADAEEDTSEDEISEAAEEADAADDSDDTSESYYYLAVDVTYYAESETGGYSSDLFYSWSSDASSQTEMTNYYYAVTSDGRTSYYQVYYTYSTSTTGGSDNGPGSNGGSGSQTTTTVTFYYRTDSSSTSWTTIGSVTSSTQNSSSVTLYQKVTGTVSSEYDGFTVDYESTEALWDESYTSSYGQLDGYYYYDTSADILYETVYYQVTLDDDGNIVSVKLYYYDGSSYVSIGTIYNPDESESTSDSITLYTAYEVDISNYNSSATVYWDLNDYDGEYNSQDGDNNSASLITSVQMNSTNVTFGESTGTTSGNTTTYSWSGGSTLSTYYTGVEDGEEGTTSLTITPASGYYVSEVIIACAPYVNGSYLSPYNCSTYITGNAYDGSFSLSASDDDDDYTLTIDSLSNLYFSHSGRGDNPIYFILIKVEKIPTPAYVEYDYGEIVNYIQDALEDDSEDTSNSSSNYSAFSTPSGWTTKSVLNVYMPTGSSSGGGVLVSDTQFKYTYNSSTETATSWKHYANSLTENAISQAAAAGYVFAGWAVTYYRDADAEASTNTYGNYDISFSDSYGTGLVSTEDEVVIVSHVRLVAQWVKVEDFTQVIDYGLPVSLGIIDELGDALTLQALTADISSRTSVTHNLYSSFTSSDYTPLEVTATLTGFAAVESEESEGSGDTEDSGGSGDSENSETTSASEDEEEGSSYSNTLTGTYGAFSINGDGDAVYTLSVQMTGVESAGYEISLTYSGSTIATPTGTLSIIPATSMYYEENFGAETTTSTDEDGNETSTTTYSLVTYNDKSSSGWSSSGTSKNYTQEDGVVGTTDDSTYGADASYLSNLQDSNGTSMCVCTTNGSASFSYTFTGTGTAIYGQISDDSGYLQVIVTALDENGNTKTTESGSTYYKTYEYIDTRVVEDVSESTTLYNIPVFDVTDLEYGTYSVTVTIAKGDQAVLNATYNEDGKEVADNKTGNYFYLDGIRIYDPIKTNTKLEDSDYDTVYDAYNADVEAENAVINISDKLLTESDGYDGSDSFISVTDAYGSLTDYDSYFVLGPDNEVYLDGENYTLTFYMVNWSDDYHLYIGLKAPGGTAASVKIGNDAYSINGSADCYYEITSALEKDTTSSLLSYDGVTSVYKVTVTGVSGLAALSYLKVTNAEDFEIAYELNVTAENEGDESSGESLNIETGTLYMISTAAYESLLEDSEGDSDTSDPEEDEDDDSEGDTEEDPDTEDDSEGDTEEDPDTEDDSDTEADPEGEDDTDTEDDVVETAFSPEKFTASISYLKLLKTATITMKTSSDVSYITVNGEKVNGRALMGTQYFTYLASKVSSGTTYEVIAYDKNDVASDPITLTAK